MLYGSKSVSAHWDQDMRKVRMLLSQVCQSCLLIFPYCLTSYCTDIAYIIILIYFFIYLVMMATRRNVVVVTVVLNEVSDPFRKSFERIG